jgi:polysaccharide deacetylase family protein (PEP-CTERM system associated)
VLNALSFDVEDYFQVAAFNAAVDRKSWDVRPSRVGANTARLLEILAVRGVRATFFVLGWIAERHPGIVRDIVEGGHEVACHGYSHELIYRQTPDIFCEETARARQVLEDQAQSRIRGYRAATWSITRDSLWALDILCEQGFEYDSSIFPTRHDLYGIPDAPRGPHQLELSGGRTLLEFPPSTIRIGAQNVPVAGGGYFRLFPLAFTRWAVRKINSDGMPFLFYLHPWEIDKDQPRVSAGLKSRIRHYTNIASCERKLVEFLSEFELGPIWDALAAPHSRGREVVAWPRGTMAHGASASP